MITCVPEHLQKYVVKQHYDSYTPEDQAVWRYIMRRLSCFLSSHAHPCYADGLKKTGIAIDSIPDISTMDEKLSEFGWNAIPVSGFIPPAAFMEFQSLGFLPIASDMRTIDHALYTPAPDIVHEAAGHAPILIDPGFSEYLRNYATVASKAVLSREDLNMYRAIRDLSDIKEHPDATADKITRCEVQLQNVIASTSYVSEAGLLGRMNWWTAEYGLIGDLDDPKIFGAGLLSSIGEAQSCLRDGVKKVPLSIDCINYSYDITEPQPQLFVTPTFEHLSVVLDELAERMAFRQGGVYGLKETIRARTVNTVELSSGLQVSGVISEYLSDKDNQPTFFKSSSATQLCIDGDQLEGHSKEYHSHGYSSPVGRWTGYATCPSSLCEADLTLRGISLNQPATIEYESGFLVRGDVKAITFKNEKLLVIGFENCTVTKGDEVFFEPAWGTFDLAVGESIPSAYGGPADRKAYAEVDDFVAARVPEKNFNERQVLLHKLYQKIKTLRSTPTGSELTTLITLTSEYLEKFSENWLPGLELLELCVQQNNKDLADRLRSHLQTLAATDTNIAEQINEGLQLCQQ